MATLAQKLQLALNSKNAIKEALISSGATITEQTEFSKYAEIISSMQGIESHGGIVVSFNLTGGSGNIIGNGSIYNALHTMYVDGELFDIDDLILFGSGSGSGSGVSGSGSGDGIGGIALPDIFRGQHTVEFCVDDGFVYRNTICNNTFAGCSVIAVISCPEQYIIKTNGHEYVDLGLPSGTLWAKCNVGASNPYEYGKYFQFGDTIGHVETSTNGTSGYNYQWSNTPFCTSSNGSTFSKYQNGESLELADDAARVNMGGYWMMPTYYQLKELYENTDIEHNVKENGVIGHKLMKKTDHSVYLFVPYAGKCSGTYIPDKGRYAYLWSRKARSGSGSAWNIFLCYGTHKLESTYRYCGLPVRGVL